MESSSILNRFYGYQNGALVVENTILIIDIVLVVEPLDRAVAIFRRDSLLKHSLLIFEFNASCLSESRSLR